MRLADRKVRWGDKFRKEGYREAFEESYQRGVIEGMRKWLLQFAQQKFGSLSDEFTEYIQAITDETLLEKLAHQLLIATRLDDMGFAMQNYQVVWPEAGIATLEPSETPAPSPGQVLIRTRTTLISPGTERAFFLGLPNTTQRFPQYPGYNNVGEVAAVGAGVTDWQVGDRIATPTGHAAYVLADAAIGVRIPDELSDERAVFFEMSAIALQGVRKARIELGEPVVVIGGGLIGLFAMQLSKIQGAAPVITVDQDEQRLDFAQQAGADAVIMADSHLHEEITRLCGDKGPAVVIEATGHPAAIPTAFDLAGWCGRVILLGSTRGETEQVNFYRDVHKKGLTVIGAHNSTRPAHDSRPGWWTRLEDQQTAMKLLALDRLVIHPLITHRFPWQQAPQAYDLLKQWNKDALGLVLRWL